MVKAVADLHANMAYQAHQVWAHQGLWAWLQWPHSSGNFDQFNGLVSGPAMKSCNLWQNYAISVVD